MVEDTQSLSKLRALYADIFYGYTRFSHPLKKDSFAYIKHISVLEQAELDCEYCVIFEDAKAKGVPDEKAAIAQLCKQDLWSVKFEDDLAVKAKEISQLYTTKKCLFLPSQVEVMGEQIKKLENTLAERREERAKLIGVTAECLALSRLNNLYIQRMMFKDIGLTEQLFDEDEFDELERSDILALTYAYNEGMGKINDKTIKTLSVCSFFQNYFNLADKNPYYFFGKPIGRLSFYQVELANYGRYFSMMLSSENRPPEDIQNDPEAIINWYNSAKNTQEALKTSKDGGAVSLSGATAADLKALGLESQVVNLADKAKAKGGTGLTIDDFAKMQGLNIGK